MPLMAFLRAAPLPRDVAIGFGLVPPGMLAAVSTWPVLGFPWSRLVFTLAGLTWPEAPRFVGLLMPFLGPRFFGKNNLLRGALFAAPLLLIPNPFAAKTGYPDGRLPASVACVDQRRQP
jgi:hypothetical protein